MFCLISQMVEYEIGNLRVATSIPVLVICRNGPPVHPVAYWYLAYGHGWHHSCPTSAYHGRSVMHLNVWRWCCYVQVQSGGKVV